jgi:hypothetical protein
LRVKELAVERRIRPHLRILLSGKNSIVDFEDYFWRHPPTAESLVLVELSLLRLRSILPGRPQHANKVEILPVDPKLRRMQVAQLCTHFDFGRVRDRRGCQNQEKQH